MSTEPRDFAPSEADCPSDAALAEFVASVAGPATQARIHAHVASCSRCAAKIDARARAHRDSIEETARDVDPAAATLATGRRPEEATIGHFTILRKIGAGTMGVVYEARDGALGRTVALKLMQAGRAASEVEQIRLMREARALARLSHPNVVQVYETGTHEGQVFMAMEYVPGGTLAAWLADEERGWREILAVFAQAGRGLSAAHAAGMVHRDFKPSNVIVGADGRVRVVDFGLVRALAGAVELSAAGVRISGIASVLDRSLTATGAVIGTPAYMAPEQIEGRRADAQTDQFGFCVALYEGLYRRRPFEGARWFELTASVLGGRVQAPPADSAVPGWVFEVLRRGLAVDPSTRWPTMDALVDALERGPDAPVPSDRPRPGRARTWLLALAVALVVAVVALLVARP